MIFIVRRFFISGSEKIENSNSIDPKSMRLIDDPVSSDGSSLNKNFLDKSSSAILPVPDTSKQLGGQLLTPNEINVRTCFFSTLFDFMSILIGAIYSFILFFLANFTHSQICSTYNLPPTTFITMKAVFLSGRDQPSRPTSTPVENKIKNYLIKSGWMKTGY